MTPLVPERKVKQLQQASEAFPGMRCPLSPSYGRRILGGGQMQKGLCSAQDIVPRPHVQRGNIVLNTALFALNTGAGLPVALAPSACHHPPSALVMGGPVSSLQLPSPVEKIMGSPSKFSPLWLLCLWGLLGGAYRAPLLPRRQV